MADTPTSFVYGGRRFALISPNWITGIFVTMDCVSIIAQSIGAAMLFNDSLSLDELKRARLILEAGLFVQVIGFSIFLFIAVWFDIKTTRHLGERIAHLRWFMNAFYISGGLIMIRSIYRLAGTYNCPQYTGFSLLNSLQNSSRLTLTHDRPLAISIVSFSIHFPDFGTDQPSRRSRMALLHARCSSNCLFDWHLQCHLPSGIPSQG